MNNYENTKRKIQYLTNQNSENEIALDRIDKTSSNKISIYCIKNQLKYYIFKDENINNISSRDSLTINLYNFPEKYLPHFNIVGFTYAKHEFWSQDFFFGSLNNSFIRIADNHYQLIINPFIGYPSYTEYLTLYFTINILRDDNG